MSELKIWYDLTNVPHVHFLRPIINHLDEKGCNAVFTLRDFLETEHLYKELISRPYLLLGKHAGGRKCKKIISMIDRIVKLYQGLHDFDVKISIGGDASEIVSMLKRKPSITFDDNELAPNWIYSRFAEYSFWTDAVEESILLKQGFRKERLCRYPGYKEDVYIADFQPDESFLSCIPFSSFVLLRSENINANYVTSSARYLFPKILDELNKASVNVVVLPRNPIDRVIAKRYDNVFVPERAINGLQACYYADAVITGAGTLAREAACMGIPAISFFAGKDLMAVDKKMIQQNMLWHSRDAIDIVSKAISAKKKDVDLKRSKEVQSFVFDKLDYALGSIINDKKARYV